MSDSDPIIDRLERAGLSLPPPPEAKGRYRTAAIAGNVLHLGAHGPFGSDGSFTHRGRIGEDLNIDEGIEAATVCGLSLLASARIALGGSLDRVAEVLTIHGYVNAIADFEDHATVVDGASRIFEIAFQDRGRAARTSVGVAGLPFRLPIVVEATMLLGAADG